jgi:hypothetical protein
MRRDRGCFYLVASDWDSEGDDSRGGILAAHPDGPTYLQVARELLVLAGLDELATRLKTIHDRAYNRSFAHFDGRDIDELLTVLGELEPAVRAALTDSDGLIPEDQVDKIRGRSERLNFGPARGATARYAVLEALGSVGGLERILGEAKQRGLVVAID